MFRLFVIVGVLIVLALFTALVGPYFIDWTAYKRDFETQASAVFGQPVRVGGNASVRLLPLPSVVFDELSVGKLADGRPMMTVERFSANVELAPLLSRKIRIVDMALQGPHFNIIVDEKGQIAWTDRKSSLFDPRQVKLDKLIVKDASFSLFNSINGREMIGEKLDAEISANSLYGPWRIKGEGRLDGAHSRFNISTGQLTEAETLRLKVSAVREGFPYEVHGDGPVSLRDSILVWKGEARVLPIGANTDPVLRGTVGPGVDPLPVRGRGKFELQPTTLDFGEWVFEVGPREDPFVLNGRGKVDLKGDKGFRLELDGRQVDMARIARMQGVEVADQPSIEERIALVRNIIERIPIPVQKGVFDLEIPAIVTGDTMVREISALVRPDRNKWRVDRLKAQLPGNTLLEYTGHVFKGDDFGVRGKLLIASRQPTGLANWLGGSSHPLVRRLNSAGIEADITLTPRQMDLRQLEIILDGKKISGRINRLVPAKKTDGSFGKPAIVAELSGEKIALEDLNALSLIIGQNDIATGSHDFDVTINAGQLTGMGLEAKGVDLKFQIAKGEVSVSRLSIDQFLDAKFSSKGQIRNILSEPRGNIVMDVSAASLASIVKEMQSRFGPFAFFQALQDDESLTADSALRVEIDSGGGSQRTSYPNRFIITGSSAKTRLHIVGGFNGGFQDLIEKGFDISVKADNGDVETLLLQAGLGRYGFKPLLSDIPGPLSLRLEAAGDAKKGIVSTLTAGAPGNALTVDGIVFPHPDRLANLQLDVTAGSRDFATVISSFGYLLPGLNPLIGEEVPFSAQLKLSRTDNKNLVANISAGQISGNQFSGEITSGMAVDGDYEAKGAFVIDRLDLPLVIGGAFGLGADGIPSTSTSITGEEFGDPVISGVGLNLDIRAAAARLGGGEVAKNFAGDFIFDGRSLRIAQAKGDWNGGEVSASAALTGGEGGHRWQMQFEADNVDVEGISQLIGAELDHSGKAKISGALDGMGRSPRAILGNLGGDAVVTLSQGMVKGIRTDGLESLLAAVDTDGYEINTKGVEELVRQTFLTQRLDYTIKAAPISVRNGKLSLRNIAINSGEKPFPSLEGEYDLVSGSGIATLKLSPSPGSEALAGATTDIVFSWRGNPRSPDFSVDVSALEGFLSLRAFENEQREVELLQASILERQRLRQDLLRSATRSRWISDQLEEAKRQAEAEAERLRLEKEHEAERLRQQEAERQRLEEEKRRIEAERRALEAARQAAEEARRQAEAARKEQEAEALKAQKAREAAEQARLAAEEAERRQQESAARLAEEAKKRREVRERQLVEDAQQKLNFKQEPSTQPKPYKQGITVKELPPITESSSSSNGIINDIEQLILSNPAQ